MIDSLLQWGAERAITTYFLRLFGKSIGDRKKSGTAKLLVEPLSSKKDLEKRLRKGDVGSAFFIIQGNKIIERFGAGAQRHQKTWLQNLRSFSDNSKAVIVDLKPFHLVFELGNDDQEI